MAKETKEQINLSNKIVLKSVRGKVGIVIKMQPSIDPETGNFPDCVKRIDSNGNMILSEKELNDPNRKYFIREDAVIDYIKRLRKEKSILMMNGEWSNNGRE